MNARLPRLPLTALALAAAVGLTGCAAFSEDGAAGTASDDGTVTVAASFYPLEFIVDRVGGDLVEVTGLTAPGQDPHDLELSVAQTASIAEADLVVVLEALQPVVADAVEQNGTGETLEVEDVITLREAEEEHDHGDEHYDEEHADEEHSEEEHSEEDGDHAHDHGDEDPHFWQDPALMAELATAVGERLGEVDAENAEAYAANAETLVAELEALDAAYADGLASCERDVVVVSHDAYGYLSKYGLDVHGIAGLSPDAEPAPAALAELQELVRDEGITTVLNERLAAPQLAQSLARDTGLETGVLDAVEGLTDETADEDYLSLMEQNLDALEQANGCS